jgi:hypothetical protein
MAVHSSDYTRLSLVSTHINWAATFMDFQVLDADPTALYGEGGSILSKMAEEYDFDLMHRALHYPGMDHTIAIPGWAVGPLVHWCDIHHANMHVLRAP